MKLHHHIRKHVVPKLPHLFSVSIVAGMVFLAQASTSTPSSTPSNTPVDNPPVISAFVKSANELHPTTIYAGLRSYISVSITDDNGLTYGGFNAPGMLYSDIEIYNCRNGVKSCREPVYVIVPERSGSYAVNVKATDTVGQTSTQVITFTAAGCSTDSECGGTYFPNSGATFCGSGSATAEDDLMKYGIAAVCTAGACKEESKPMVLEDCGLAGKLCGFDLTGGGTYKCVSSTSSKCVSGEKIPSTACMCGSQSYAGYGYCCLNGDGNQYHQSSGPCPVWTAPSPIQPSPTPTTSPTSTPATTTSTPQTIIVTPQPTVSVPQTTVTQPQPTVNTPVVQVPTSTLIAVPAQPMTSTPVVQFIERIIQPIIIAPTTTQFAPPIERQQVSDLKAFKRWGRSFERDIAALEKKVKQIERSGIAIPKALKDTLAQAKTLIKRIKTLKRFDAVDDLEDEMFALETTLNEHVQQLEYLSLLPEALRIMKLHVAEAERLLKAAASTVKKLKIETAVIEEMDAYITDMRAAVTMVKEHGVPLEETAAYIEERIVEPLAAIRDGANQIRSLINVRQRVNTVAAAVKRFNTQIRAREKAGEETEELRALLGLFQEQLEELRPFVNKRVTKDSADELLLVLRSIAETQGQLEELLELAKPDTLEKQLDRLFEPGSEKFKRFEFPEAGG